ncbi:hypothetical protein DITRI_Ditri13aG0094600 [Diplodiscus trichospermus]
MTEMNGVHCSTMAMPISAETPKKTTVFQQQYVVAKAVYLYRSFHQIMVIPIPQFLLGTWIQISQKKRN